MIGREGQRRSARGCFTLPALLLSGCESPFLPPARIATLQISPDSAVVALGGHLQLAVAARDSAGHSVAAAPVVWMSADERVAVVSSQGVVTALASGQTAISARAQATADTATVTVVVPITAVAVDQPDQTMVPGGQLRFTATGFGSDGAPRSDRPTTWTSSDTTVAAVTPAGLVIARDVGSVTLTAEIDGISGSRRVSVTRVRFTDLSASEAAHTCGVAYDGRVFCWGSDNLGQLGNGTTAPSTTPVAVVGDERFTQVSGGGTFTCALAIGGSAYCWGSSARGRLGAGAQTTIATPVAVSGGGVFETLSAGWNHSCALTGDGVAVCWGEDPAAGDPTRTTSPTPAAVAIGPTLVAASAGTAFTCGVTVDRLAYCWGSNAAGQLGTDAVAATAVPVAVQGTGGVTTIAGGGLHACALLSDGAAYCWGANDRGQLGTGDLASSASPVPVSGELRFQAIVAGAQFTCGLAGDGAAWCWGDNGAGQLGTGDTSGASHSAPVLVTGGLHFTLLTAGDQHACGLTTDGVAYCWGANGAGQLGDGTTTGRAAPVRVAGQP